MDLKLESYNVRDATMRSLLALAHEFGVRYPTKEQQEKLAEISDALEARVQDELDSVMRRHPLEQETSDEKYVEWSEVVQMENGALLNVNGTVYQKACNEPVFVDDEVTYCIKQWDHKSPKHEDKNGMVSNG